MQSFSERLTQAIKDKHNPTVMGLDPLLEYIPDDFKAKYREDSLTDSDYLTKVLFDFNCALIDAVADIIPAVKPQSAYYELYGLAGLKALHQTIRYAQAKGLLVILDAKRNDIGSTAAAYAKAYLGETATDSGLQAFWDADALTVNPYFGIDGIKPFAEEAFKHGKGLFILVRTSNPSAGDFQDLVLEDGRTLYTVVAEKISEWSKDYVGADGLSPLGVVVGATWPEQALDLRRLLPHAYILVPGYGAQGGTADSCRNNFKADGTAAIVNASRSLMCAWQKAPVGTDFRLATRTEALKMQAELNAALHR